MCRVKSYGPSDGEQSVCVPEKLAGDSVIDGIRVVAVPFGWV